MGVFWIILNVLVFLGNSLLALYVFLKNPRSALHRSFFALAVAVALWILINVAALRTDNEILFRMTYALGTFLPLLGLWFAYILVQERFSLSVKLFLIGLDSIFALLVFS
ncbi:MAG: hypothetical protein ACK4NX_01940, partial [Candidatus Paceibacteria bacterium]